MITRCFAVIASTGRAFFVSKPKRSKSQQPGACAFKGEVHKLTLSNVTLTNVVQSSSLLTVRLHRLNFCIVVRFYSSIYSNDKMLIVS